MLSENISHHGKGFGEWPGFLIALLVSVCSRSNRVVGSWTSEALRLELSFAWQPKVTREIFVLRPYRRHIREPDILYAWPLDWRCAPRYAANPGDEDQWDIRLAGSF
jgi:hypothetical protein